VYRVRPAALFGDMALSLEALIETGVNCRITTPLSFRVLLSITSLSMPAPFDTGPCNRDALWDVAAAQPSRPLLIPNAGYLEAGAYTRPLLS